jgi:tRNA pseudouridine55 synthase
VNEISGVVVVDKPGGMTSHDVINRLRKIFGTKRIGHAGTLDPLATGVLVVCIGQATRILEYLAATTKRYKAGILFGIRTDSQDITGVEISRTDTSELSIEEINGVLPRFRGRVLQTPPMHSALHHEGTRLYELARQGIEVERKAREIEVYRLDLMEFTPGPNAHAVVDVECSSGTYIRTLAADIGEAVGTGAVMDTLRRTAVGSFGIEQGWSLERLLKLKESGRLTESLSAIPEALPDWPRVILSELELTDVRHGRKIAASSKADTGKCLLLNVDGAVVALAQSNGGEIAPFKVFGSNE